MSTLSQKRFSGGEISPALYAGTDLAKYQSGLRTLRNYYVMRHGGIQSRAGTEFVCEVGDSTKAVRLIPFVFNASQTYILEFGNLYLRIIKNGEQIRETGFNISAVTNANPAVVTTATHSYTTGDEVYISGVTGAMANYINGRNFKITVLSATTFSLQAMDGTTNVNSSGWGSYTSGGTSARVYEVVTPYLEADLMDLQYVQSADVVTIVHPDYPPSNLSRTGDAAWSFEAISFAPGILPPTGISTATPASTALSITSITSANPAVITTSGAHGYATNDEVEMSRLDFRVLSGLVYKYYTVPKATYKVTVLTATTFTAVRTSDLSNFVAPTGYSFTNSRYTGKVIRTVSGGTPSYVSEWCVTSIAEDTYEESEQSEGIGTGVAPTTGAPIDITWTAASGAQGYNVYRKSSLGIFGFVAYTERTTFTDNGAITPDTTETPPAVKQNFKTADDWPSCVAYYQQRRLFGNTNNEPEKIWASRTGFFTNYTVSSPLQDDDAVTFTMAGRQVNEIRHMLDLGKLVVFTAGGEWTINGDSAGTLLPGDVNPKQGSYNGASSLPPIVIGGSALYVQARGSYVRDLDFDYTVENYRGGDLTIFSSHLVEGYSLTDWTYTQIPNSIVWCVRSDGTMLGLTYVKEQQMLAWHRHDTEGGLIENVCSVPEGDEDVLYVVVNRTIGSSTYRYVERMASRFITIDTIKDFKGMDSFSSYDGRHTGSTTMTLSGSGWTYEDTLTLTASASYFASSDVGNSIHLTGSDDTLIRCTITAYTSATVVSVTPHKTVPVAMRAVAITEWAKGVSQVTGLWHLEGMDVSVFGDGFVLANPNNDAYEIATITNGVLTLDDSYTVIHVGIPITADFETLNIDTPQGETIADKHQIVNGVSLFVEKTRGLWVGSQPPTDEATDFLDGLTEIKIRNEETYDEPVTLTTGTVDVNIESTWNSNGRIFVRQTDPVPATILAIAPAGLFPFRS
jgi:Ubiquitin-activating enzyme E1 FCCH domain